MDKFEAIRFWAKQGEAPDFNYQAPDNTVIQKKTDVKDLGIILSNNLSFRTHIATTVTAASKLAGWGPQIFPEEKPESYADCLENTGPAQT